MKKIILVSTILFVLFANSFSQDVIVKKDGSEIKSKVVEIQEDFIKYTLFDSSNGPLRNIRIYDVFMIIYEDGTRETFVKSSNEQTSESSQIQQTNQTVYPPQVKEVPKTINSTPNKKPYGFIIGAELGGFIPFNSDYSKVYGSLFQISIIAGYWGNRFGIETQLAYGTANGEPYSSGTLRGSTSEIETTQLKFTGYLKSPQPRVFFYFGGGFGIANVAENIETPGGQTYSGNVDCFDIHAKIGMKINHFCWNVDLSSLTPTGGVSDQGSNVKTDTNLGGATISISFFF